MTPRDKARIALIIGGTLALCIAGMLRPRPGAPAPGIEIVPSEAAAGAVPAEEVVVE